MSNENRVLAYELDMLAKFVGYDYIADEYTVDDLKYHESRDWLHDVWAKFRELRFEEDVMRVLHVNYIARLANILAYGTLTDFYNSLIKAVEWYNSTVKK